MAKTKPKVVLVVHNVRSAYNVGSMMRTAEGLGVEDVYLTGFTPYPFFAKDSRPPHIAAKADRMIAKTALGAENSLKWSYKEKISELINEFRREDYSIVALEQTSEALLLPEFKLVPKVALIVGSEVGGLTTDVLDLADQHVQIPMQGAKESFNVSVAAAIALYHLKYLA